MTSNSINLGDRPQTHRPSMGLLSARPSHGLMTPKPRDHNVIGNNTVRGATMNLYKSPKIKTNCKPNDTFKLVDGNDISKKVTIGVVIFR